MESSCQGVDSPWTAHVQPMFSQSPPPGCPGSRLLAAPQQSKTLFFQSPTHSSPEGLWDREPVLPDARSWEMIRRVLR
ncbi:hypothetical protein CgunFtcFv8_021336 [Champsocephalus gunnari]|uniref:Uncharacterized protein n=1 Tax=Champsocephalus gunnari TaxID=52237 RepID=A0AAN8EG17_CHAGU|nr:hypothetical protein CgunFtcFv8_021336 [Champsocephalus gunnari]